MRNLFGPQFSKMRHDVRAIRLVAPTSTELSEVGVSADDTQTMWVQLETDTNFWLKGKNGAQDQLVVENRMLTFLVGRTSSGAFDDQKGSSSVEHKGTNGLWILMGKAWWDTTGLTRLMNEQK